VRTLFRHPRRVWQVIAVFTTYLVRPVIPFRRGPTPGRPVRVRLALERLGGAWIKLGQMLAMRYDLLPAAYCDELFGLLNQVAPFPYDQVREIVRQELGDVPEVVYRSFEPESFAAASIGQVHRAVLPTGEAVAVKVQRPKIRETLKADIDLMYSLTWVFDRTHLFGASRSRTVIDEFARWTADELDYLVEARQAMTLHEHAGRTDTERIARVHREYTTSRVLTSELIEGVPLIDVMVALRTGDEPFLEHFRANGHDLDRVMKNLDWNMLNQVYVSGYFHADLHPANLFVMPGDAIGYVDLGIVGQLPGRVRDSLTRYSWLLFRGEVEPAIQELMRWLTPTPETDSAAARWHLIRIHQAFLYDVASRRPGSTSRPPGPVDRAAENPYSRLAVEIMRVIREHHLVLAQSVVAYLKMLVTIGALRHELATSYDLSRHVRRFFSRLMRQRAVSWFDPRLSLDHLYAARVRATRALEFLEFIEAQEPVILEAESTLFGFRRRMRSIKQSLIRLGVATVSIGVVLYVILANRTDTERALPRELPYPVLQIGLTVVLVLLVIAIVNRLRGLGEER
jgi:ubiquinone biosynthesis protein